MLSPLQQAVDLIQKGNHILIALPENLNGDSLGSALALETALKNLGKKIEIVCEDEVPEKLKFLAGLDNLKKKVTSWRDFIISVDTSENKISRLRYEKENNLLKIFLTSAQNLAQRDIKLEPGPFFYDLVITIDSPDLESLGKTYEVNTGLFFDKPVLNIDHKAANEYFGAVNLVEPTAAACAQIAAGLIDCLGPDLINETSATALLTGLVAKTHSFQNARTTPQALSLASLLITKGGEQEKIIQSLYKTVPLNRLRLWGQLLSRLDFDSEKNIIWLRAEAEDFTATQTQPQDLPFVLEEIEDLFPQIKFSIILWRDQQNAVWALIKAKQLEILQRITLELGGALKNEKLLLKMTEPDFETAKKSLAAIINF